MRHSNRGVSRVLDPDDHEAVGCVMPVIAEVA